MPVPSSLVQWINQLGLQSEFIPSQIQSGRAVNRIMKIIIPQYNLQLLASNTAVNRVSNWNNLISTQLKKIGIKVSQQDKTKIINGNHDVVYQVIARLYEYNSKNQKQTEVDISKIDPKSQLSQSSSLLQLFILAIMKYFGLNPKQSVALLSSDCKYLAHILVKGLKGEFKPVEGLITELYKNVEIISTFCKNKQNEVFFIKAIKPALISKSDVASQKTMLLLDTFLSPLTHKYQIVKQHFFSTLLLAIRRHPHLIQQLIKFTVKTTNFSKQILSLFKNQATEGEIQMIFLALFNFSKDNKRFQEFYALKGINQVINKAIENIKNAQTTVSSLNLLLILSTQNTELLSNPEKGSKFIEYIQQVTLSKKSQNLVFIEQLFSMLSIFGKDKNQLAPAIFKFLIVKFQSTINSDQNATFLQNFKQTVQQFPTIPFSIIVESINTRIENGTLVAGEAEMQFFRQIAKNQSLDVKTALIIYNIVSKLLVDEPAYVGFCSQILISIVKKFINQAVILDLTLKLIKVCLAIHFANVKRLAARRKSVTGTSKIEVDDALFKSKNLGMQEFLYKIVSAGIDQINSSSEPLICYSLIQILNISKQNGNGLKRIVSLFGNPTEVVKKYELEAKKLEEEEHKKQQVKKSKLKQSAWGHGRYNQSPNNQKTQNSKNRSSSHVSSQDGLKSKGKTKLDPMLLSHVGVASSAIKGLQKYQKSYLNKVEKVQQEQAKKKQDLDRQQYLKVIFQRKMLDKGIDVNKSKGDQFQCLYQFGVKQKQLQSDTVKNVIGLSYYLPEQQEERDIKALQYTLKKYQRIIKLYYNIYSGHNKPQNLDSFDQIAQKVNLLYSASLWKMIKQNFLDEFISVKQVQYLCKKINHHLSKKFDDPTALDYQGFQNFIVQLSFSMFTRPPKDLRGKPVSEMIEQTISRLKLYAAENKINESLFEDPDNIFYNETQAIKQLNKKLQTNSEYILPEGYKKIVDKKIVFTHRIFLDAMSEEYKDVYEIIDEILNKSLGVHIIEPFTTYQTVAKARPTLYYKQRQQGEVQSEKISGFMKKQLAKMPIKDREIGKQVAVVLDEIVQAVEFGHDKVGIKHENKVLKEKKQAEEEQMRKQNEQKRKWAQRNREIKSALVKHKQVTSQKQKQDQDKKAQEKRKQEEQKKRKEQQDLRLKRKVESYQAKKKEEEEIRKKQEAQQKRKEKETQQRKKKQADQIKRKIEETRIAKQQEEKRKKKQQEALQKERKLNQKKKMQEEQKKKKQKVEEYKNKKLQTQSMGQSLVSSMKNELSQIQRQVKQQVKAMDSSLKMSPKVDRKKLV